MNVHDLLLNFDNAWLEKEFSGRAMVLQRGQLERGRLRKPQKGEHGIEVNGSTLAVCRVLGRYLMEIFPDDRGCSTHLAMNGYWELPVTLAIAKHVPRKSRCIDVGTNVGYFTVLLAAAMACHVTAWEPQERLGWLLHRTLELNGLRDSVSYIQAAAHSTNKRLNLYLDDSTANASETMSSAFDLMETVAAQTIDSIHDSPIDFVKIDAEGAEPDIILGMQRLIENSPQLQICMEFTPRLYGDASGFLDKLSERFLIQGIRDDGALRTIERAALLNAAEFEMIWLIRKE